MIDRSKKSREGREEHTTWKELLDFVYFHVDVDGQARSGSNYATSIAGRVDQ